MDEKADDWTLERATGRYVYVVVGIGGVEVIWSRSDVETLSSFHATRVLR